jgi:hypothetical protein
MAGGYLSSPLRPATLLRTVSGFILTCRRTSTGRPYGRDVLSGLARALAPSNITPHSPILHESPELSLAVLNPVAGVRQKGSSVCLGTLLDAKADWWKVGRDSPDGSYAICRSDEDSLEVVADDFGSRPTWYVHTPEVFLAATSQRAVIRLLGDHDPNPQAVSWMLSAGCLGPEDSWDRRLRRVPPATRLALDRHTWELTAHRAPPAHDEEPVPMSRGDQVAMMADALARTCESLDLGATDWRLPLSGGKDSRCLLIYLLRAGHRPRCVTWGMERSLLGADSDAHVAARVAEAMGVEDEYFVVDRSKEPPRDVLGRYLAVGEGLVDHVSAYLDGLDMWRELLDSGVVGVIRGEIAMGWYEVRAPEQGRRSIVPALTDYAERSIIRRLGLADQTWPGHLRQQPGETAQQHADRLYLEIRLPRVLAPLNHLKSAYVEIAEPLLSRPIARVTRRILLTGRALPVLRALAERDGPARPFATAPALASVERCAREEAFAEEMRRELSSANARRVFSASALELLLAGMNAGSSDRLMAWKASLRSATRLAPALSQRLGTRVMPLSALPYQLAFRAYIASRTLDMLATDAARSTTPTREASPIP